MLALFDIDGTLLIKAADAHRDAIHAALRRVHGIAIPRVRVETAGRTDGAICRLILEAAGVEPEAIDARWPEVAQAACEEFAARVPGDLSHTVSDGMHDVLEALAARDDVTLALLTGNLEPIARVKLDRAGVGGFFADGQGAFGSDHELRERLPEVARRRAGTDDDPFPRARTVVIGDTPRDIACARADGVRCVAIATGPFGADALDAADVVVDAPNGLLRALDGLRTR
ncbi:haloacid dehalogenase-like hydrolase [Conexibacter sp. SYSU D00693]|uniref:haloacid dehalogenase-like hydrolase n=1 Tax=Conexibacter sp. SYSU D00693 TaxID=2812560 RepID=UPI00196B7406|nr:haloacid dehalogenase-like hydrolase [Conexibacter sp. SYSU D00693]